MRISDWSADVCSSDLLHSPVPPRHRRSAAAALWLLVVQIFLSLQRCGSMERTIEARPEDRRVGKACGSTCSTRRSPYHYTQPAHSTHTLLASEPPTTILTN